MEDRFRKPQEGFATALSCWRWQVRRSCPCRSSPVRPAERGLALGLPHPCPERERRRRFVCAARERRVRCVDLVEQSGVGRGGLYCVVLCGRGQVLFCVLWLIGWLVVARRGAQMGLSLPVPISHTHTHNKPLGGRWFLSPHPRLARPHGPSQGSSSSERTGCAAPTYCSSVGI